MDTILLSGIALPVIILLFVLLTLWKGIKVVPQSQVFVIERFGKNTKTLKAGLNLIIPYLDVIAHKVSILERQLEEFDVSVITKDNVEVDLTTTVFFRIDDAAKSVYRIAGVDAAVNTAATSIIRSAAGKLELDELQSSRDSMAQEILKNLDEAAKIWGIDITRTEITDVIVDEQTKDAQRQQINAERKRRAAVTEAEGNKQAVQLNADAELYEAKKQAEAVKVAADAEAQATIIVGEANAAAIKAQGVAMKDAPDFIALEKARQWNGVVPTTVISGDAPALFMNLGDAEPSKGKSK